MSKFASVISFREPPYYAPEDQVHPTSRMSRVAYAALPFLALHKPLGRVIALAMDATRTVSSLRQMVEKRGSREILATVLAVATLAGTYFLHPVGLGITALRDLGCDLQTIVLQLQLGHTQEAVGALFSMVQHLLYMGTMVTSPLELVAVALLLNMAMEIHQSRREFQKGRFIEGVSHLLMSLVRFSQALPCIDKVAQRRDLRGKALCHSLTETVAQARNRAALFFYSSARILVHPHWKMTDLWLGTVSLCRSGQSSTARKVGSVARSTLATIALLPFSLPGLALGQTAHFSAYLLSTAPYLHLKGSAPARTEAGASSSVLQLNCCLTAGGFSRMFGGLDLPDAERADKIAELIRAQNPDVVCLQEVSDLDSAFRLYKGLAPEYAEFYLNMGATPFILQNNSGLFVASKWAISNPEFQSFGDIAGTESMVNKGFFRFSTEIGDFITTHLSPSSDDFAPTEAAVRTRAFEQERIIAATRGRPCFILGDFNIQGNSREYYESHLFQGQPPTSGEATCESDYLIGRNWKHNQAIQPNHMVLDYFVPYASSDAIETRRIETYDLDHPELAISDHAALLTTIKAPARSDHSLPA